MEVNAGFDEPSAKDWTAAMVAPFFGGSEEQPVVQIGKKLRIQDQGKEEITKNGCNLFKDVHAVNAMNQEEEGIKIDVSGKVHRLRFVEEYSPIYKAKYGKDPIEYGSVLQDGLNFTKKWGYIEGFYLVSTVDQMKAALNKGHVIGTGSNRIVRRETRKKPYFAVRGKGSGHLFCITGYNDIISAFICANSYGPNNYDNGYFYVAYDDIDLLYSRYAMINKKDYKTVKQIALKKELAKIVLQRTKGNPSDAQKQEYGVFFDYWFNRGDRPKL